MDNIWILAQAPGISSEPVTSEQTTTQTADETIPDSGAPPTKPRSAMPSMIMIGLMFVVFYFLIFRGPRKKEQKHKQMVQSLNKNDKIRTIGGILGTIVDIKDDEVVLKIDESNNTKIRISTNAIGRNLSKD